MNYRILEKSIIFEIPYSTLDQNNGKECKKKILSAYLSTNAQNFIINLHKVQTIDAAGLEVLLFAGSLIQEAHGKISLFGLTPNVKKTLMQSRMYRFFDINRTLEESLEFIKDTELTQLYEYNALRKKLLTHTA